MNRKKALILFCALTIICFSICTVITHNRANSINAQSKVTEKNASCVTQNVKENQNRKNLSVTQPETENETVTVVETTTTSTTATLTNNSITDGKKVTWKAVSGATSYNVYRSTSLNGKYTYIGNTGTNEYLDTSASKDTKYYYRVKAIDSTSNSTAARTTVTSATTCKNTTTVVTTRTTTTSSYVKTESTTQYGAPSPISNGTGRVTGYENEMLRIVNEARAKVGATPLVLSSDLTRLSSVRAEELSRRYSEKHTRPDGRAWYTIFNDLADPNLKNWKNVAENIAYGQKDCNDIMNAWLNSKGHYENIVNKDYSYVGFGCYSKNGVLYWDQLFLG